MTSVEELQHMISRGEDTQTEFKAVLSDDVLNRLSTNLAAMANSQGGRIIFGVTDQKDPVGLTLTGDEFNRISQCASNCLPAVRAEPEIIRFGTRSFIVVSIPKSTTIHNDHQKKFPLRLGTTTHYLDALEIATILQERGFLKSEGQLPVQYQSFQYQVPKQEKLPIPEPEATKIVARLRSRNPAIRAETLADLVSVQYRTLILSDARVADVLGTILLSDESEEIKQLFDLFRYMSLWGSADEKKVLSGWLSTVLKIGKTSASPDIQRASFNVLMYSKNKGAVDLLTDWVSNLEEQAWTVLQPWNLLRDLGDLKSLARDEMYKILDDSKDEALRKRSLVVLNALRQIP